jgi:hypothetical protein
MTQGQQPPTLSYASATVFPYESARPRARVVIVLSWVLIGVHLLLIWPSIVDVLDLQRFIRGEEIADEPTVTALMSLVLGVVLLIVYLVVVIFWLMWVHRTYRNLPALGAVGLNYTPGWAVGYHFIPILNLFRPLQVMRETWRASDVRYSRGTDWQVLNVPALLGWWWAMHLISAIVNQISFRVYQRSEDAEVLLAVAWVDLFMLGFDILLLLVEIGLVRRLTNLQEQRAAATGAVQTPASFSTPAAERRA